MNLLIRFQVPQYPHPKFSAIILQAAQRNNDHLTEIVAIEMMLDKSKIRQCRVKRYSHKHFG